MPESNKTFLFCKDIQRQVDDLEKRVQELETTTQAMKRSLIDFDNFVVAALGQITEAVGTSGTLTAQIAGIQTSSDEVRSTLESVLSRSGDLRLISSIQDTVTDIKTALNVK